MKKRLIGILSSIVILGSGFFISNMNTSNKDVHKDEKVVKEKKNKKDNKSNSKNIEKDVDIVEKSTENSKNTNSEEVKTKTSENKKPMEIPQTEIKHKSIEITNIEKIQINQLIKTFKKTLNQTLHQ